MLIPEDAAVLPHKMPLGGDGGGAVQLGDHVDDTAAADAHRFLARLTHNGQHRLQRLPVDGHGLHRAVGGPHAAGDIAALKGGTRGAGAGHHKVPVAEHDLAVGAQIDEQGKFVLIPDPAGQRTGGDIAAHIGTDVGGKHHSGVRIGDQADVTGLQAIPAEKGRNVRLHPHGIGVHAQQQMVHGGVGGHAAAQDTLRLHAGAAAQRPGQRLQSLLHDGLLQALHAAGPSLLHNAVDHVRAVADLPVAAGTLGQQLSGLQVHQHRRNRGGADIDSKPAHGLRRVKGPQIHHLHDAVVQRTGRRHMEAALPQHRRQLMYRRIAQAHLLTAESVLQRQRQPLRVGHGILQRRRLHGDLRLHKVVAECHTRCFQILLQPGKDCDLLSGGQVGGLHAALVGGSNVRHQHRHIGRHLAGAAQTPAGGIVLVGDMTGL